MQKLNFSIDILAPKSKVWSVLWNDDSYRKWTSIFSEGSFAKTDGWKEGSKVLFLSPDGDGMVSRVAANKPYELMSFEHLGIVKNGVEDTSSQAWAGAHENYTLKETGGVTTLFVEMDTENNFKEYFTNTWPKALEQVKILSETN